MRVKDKKNFLELGYREEREKKTLSGNYANDYLIEVSYIINLFWEIIHFDPLSSFSYLFTQSQAIDSHVSTTLVVEKTV